MLISHKPENDGILTVFQKIPSDLTDKAETLLKFVGLHQKRKLRAGDLSFGQQKLLELAMALMNEPKMLLLDEPTAGINPTLINGIIDRLISVNKDYGITLVSYRAQYESNYEFSTKSFLFSTWSNVSKRNSR